VCLSRAERSAGVPAEQVPVGVSAPGKIPIQDYPSAKPRWGSQRVLPLGHPQPQPQPVLLEPRSRVPTDYFSGEEGHRTTAPNGQFKNLHRLARPRQQKRLLHLRQQPQGRAAGLEHALCSPHLSQQPQFRLPGVQLLREAHDGEGRWKWAISRRKRSSWYIQSDQSSQLLHPRVPLLDWEADKCADSEVQLGYERDRERGT